MPDSCSLSLSISPLCSLPSPFHARSKTSFSICGQRSFTNRECQSPRPPRGDIFFFSLSFLSLSFCVVLSLHSFIRPSFFYVALSLSFPVHRQACRPFPLKFSVADVIVPSLPPSSPFGKISRDSLCPLMESAYPQPLPNEKTGNAAAVPNRLPNKVRTPPPSLRFFPPLPAPNPPQNRQMLRVVYRFRTVYPWNGGGYVRKSGEIGRKIIRGNWVKMGNITPR